jgi:The GLUG motif
MNVFRGSWAALAISTLLLLAVCTPMAHASLRISSNPTQNMSCSSGVCTPTARNAVLNASDLAGMLASGDVTVSSGHVAKDIEMSASLSWVSGSRLTLDAYDSITFSKVVDVAGTGAMTLTTEDGGSDGDLYFSGKGRVDFRDTSSSLIINGNSYVLLTSIRALKNATMAPYVAFARNVNSRKVYSSAPIQLWEGTLEGLGHSISNFTISSIESQEDGLGLVAVLEAGTIRDLRLLDVNIQGVSEGDTPVGAIAGEGGGSIIGVSVTGQVSSTGPNTLVGGLVGLGSGVVLRCSADVSVTGGSTGIAGGLIGHVEGFARGLDVIQDYATGSVTGGDGTMVGGLVGLNEDSAIEDSYASGSVTGGSGAFVGGLVGTNELDNGNSTAIHSSYATGMVSGGSGALVGGLIGQDLAQTGTANAYWDLDTSGVSDPSQGAGNVSNDPGITGLTSVQFQSGLPAGFDASVWAQSPTINGGFPYLAENPPQ